MQSLSGVKAPPLLPSSQEDGHTLQHEPFEGDIWRWVVAAVRIDPSCHFGGTPAQKHFLQRWGVQVRQVNPRSTHKRSAKPQPLFHGRQWHSQRGPYL